MVGRREEQEGKVEVELDGDKGAHEDHQVGMGPR